MAVPVQCVSVQTRALLRIWMLELTRGADRVLGIRAAGSVDYDRQHGFVKVSGREPQKPARPSP